MCRDLSGSLELVRHIEDLILSRGKGQIYGTVDVEMERELLGQTAEHTWKIEEECLVSCGEMK